MELKGTYFNGQTSRPYPILIQVDNESISFLSADEHLDVSLPQWNLRECKIESLNASDHVLITHSEHLGEKMEFSGDYARQMVTLVSQDDGVITRSYQNMMVENPIRVIFGGLLVLGVVSYLYLAHFSPFFANRVVDIIPQSAEVAMGKSSMNQMTSFYDVNTEKSEILQQFYHECGFESEYPIQVQVIDDEMVNAFAAPGGHIIVFQGIIDKTASWEALAGLLAHEKAHVEERHSLRLLARSVSSFLIISALTGDVAGVTGLMLENVHRLNELSNSRDYEEDADRQGLSYLHKLQIRPEGMVELFELLLEQQETELSENMEFLSTHPLSQNRIADIKKTIDEDDSFDYQPIDNQEAERLWLALKSQNTSNKDGAKGE